MTGSRSPHSAKKKTRVLTCINQTLSDADLSLVTRTLASDGVIVFPTDTVYGIGCNAFQLDAINAIYKLKGRSYSKPLPLLLGDSLQLDLVAKEIPQEAFRLIEAYWPGALTLVFKTAPMALLASRGKSSVAVRIPDHGVIRQILVRAKVPLASTSANRSGKPAFTNAVDAVKAFDGKVDLIIDGGLCDVGRESSVVDATHYPFTILREGAISKQKLELSLRKRDNPAFPKSAN